MIYDMGIIDTDLWAHQQHRAVLGAWEEGKVVDAQSVFLL